MLLYTHWIISTGEYIDCTFETTVVDVSFKNKFRVIARRINGVLQEFHAIFMFSVTPELLKVKFIITQYEIQILVDLATKKANLQSMV